MTVKEAADKLAEHIVFYALEERVGTDRAEFFVSELAMISGGDVLYGAAVGQHAVEKGK